MVLAATENYKLQKIGKSILTLSIFLSCLPDTVQFCMTLVISTCTDVIHICLNADMTYSFMIS